MDYEEWFKKGLKCIENDIRPGMTFEVKKLFVGLGWEQLSKGDRISFGKYFSSAVNDGRIPNVIKIGRGKDNHTLYKKTGNDSNR